jgi:hypothetical protein
MKISHLAAAVAAIAICGSTPALGSGNAQTSNTVGNCISDGLYGNEPNIEPFAPGGPAEQEPGTKGGTVVPSQSPGPFVNTGPNPPPRNDRTRGSSVGSLNQQFGGGAVPAACRAATGTGASRTTGPVND